MNGDCTDQDEDPLLQYLLRVKFFSRTKELIERLVRIAYLPIPVLQPPLLRSVNSDVLTFDKESERRLILNSRLHLP